MLGFIAFLVVAYLIGSIPFGVLLTRIAGLDDVRSAGSGNIGATNVYRVAGRRLGVLTLVADALKGLVPVLAAVWMGYSDPRLGFIAAALFLGHCYPVYIGFKGGKGVATALGIYLVLSPWSVLGAFALFALLLWRFDYVSLASISAAAVIPLLVLLIERSLPLFLATLFISGMVVLRHRGNIQRLLDGSENRFRS